MSLQKSLHTRSRLFRDLFVSMAFILIGYISMPTHFLVSDQEFQGLMSGLALGFGFGWMLHALQAAKQAGKIDPQNHITFDDKE